MQGAIFLVCKRWNFAQRTDSQKPLWLFFQLVPQARLGVLQADLKEVELYTCSMPALLSTLAAYIQADWGQPLPLAQHIPFSRSASHVLWAKGQNLVGDKTIFRDGCAATVSRS